VRVAPYILVPTPGTGKPNPGVALARRTPEGRQRLLCPRKTTPNAHQKNNFRNLAWRSGMLDLPRRTMPETKPSKPAQQCRGMQRSLERSQTTKKHPARRSRETFSRTACSKSDKSTNPALWTWKTTDPPQTFSGVRPVFEGHATLIHQSILILGTWWNAWIQQTSIPIGHRIHDVNYYGRDDAILFILNWHAPYLSTHFQSSSFNKMQNQSTFQQQRSSEIKCPISLSTKNDPSSVWRKISLNLKSFWRSKVKKWRS